MLLAAVLIVLLCAAVCGAQEDIPRGVGSWPADGLGNHRAVVRVEEPSDAVWVHITWRRRDDAQDNNIVIIYAATGEQVTNVVRAEISREAGDVVFQAGAAGEYQVYYMPYTASTQPWGYATRYSSPEDTADPAWVDRHGLTPAGLAQGEWRTLPRATVVEIQARTDFDRFDPMEVPASAAEMQDMLARHPGVPYLLFPEDREHAIRMTADLPLRWVRNGPSSRFDGAAQRGEFYVFQIGLYAARERIEGLEVTFDDLTSDSGERIPAAAFHCFNLGGTDWLGRSFEKDVTVPQGAAQALWFGVQLPEGTQPGELRGALNVRPLNLPETRVDLSITVGADAIADHGDNDLWRQARLRWLDSTIGLDDEVVAPYTALHVAGRTVSCLGREVRFADTGLPESITSSGREILAKPIAMVAEVGEGRESNETEWGGGRPRILKQAPGAVTWQSSSAGGRLEMRCWAKMECDGYINFRVTIAARQRVEVKDIRLEIPMRREAATYMMGLGRTGGYRPEEWQWAWDARRANNSVWVGDVAAGLYCKLKDPADSWSLGGLPDLPAAWHNGGRGGCIVSEEGNDIVTVRAYSGERALQAGEELEFCFGLLVTPVKSLDPAHWNQRYYHAAVPAQTAVDAGANIINVHHGNDLNPNINYPFLAANELAAYVNDAHAKNVAVKIYYTVRELSNYVAEIWALRSLGHEVFTDGTGGGHSWLCEHLVDHYAPAWHHTFEDGRVDAAMATTGLSRWHNYYLEGLAWLLGHVEIDGLYLDGIGYNREIMKRVRKVMDRMRPGSLMDFHSGNDFTFNDRRVSPACLYMEHFPYVNSLWFGEGYDYNESPDYWLVEISGIPFGLFGEMLQDNGNPWRGMVYGMTARYYSGADPKHIWRLWDEFGIQDARMIGYWDPACPVRTDHQDVLATAYVKPDKTLVSIASWARESLWGKQPVRCRLRVDWAALGLDPEKATIVAPAIPGFQDAAEFRPPDEIPVESGKGWLLVLSEDRT